MKERVSRPHTRHMISASLQMQTDSTIVPSWSSVSWTDWKPAMAKLDRPVLVMCESAIQSMTADPVKKNVPTAQVEVFADAGHALFVDDVERFNSVLDAFVKSLPIQ